MSEVQHAEHANQDKQQINQEEILCRQRTKIVWAVLVIVTGTTVAAMVVFLLVQTSHYFSKVFAVLADQTVSKQYLKQYYRPYLITVYISALGLVIVGSDTVLYFLKFSQKHKLLCIHIVFTLLLVVSGGITLTDYGYQSHMSSLGGFTTGDAGCSGGGYTNECQLSADFAGYHYVMMVFVVVVSVMFALYTVLYHIGVVYIQPSQSDQTTVKELPVQAQSHLNPIQQSIVSQMFDDYKS